MYTHTQWPRNGARPQSANFAPRNSNLRSLPKRMNTWPKKNLMTMTNDVRNNKWNHVLKVVNPDIAEKYVCNCVTFYFKVKTMHKTVFFKPSKCNLRSLPKRMNTWPKQNLMTMMSDVRNKMLNHVLYLVNVTEGACLREWIHGLKRTWWRWRVMWECYWDSDQIEGSLHS